MGLARIDIQELGPGRWVVELESGIRSRHRRQLIRATSFDGAVAAVGEAYRASLAPPPAQDRAEAVMPQPETLIEPQSLIDELAKEKEAETLTGRATEDQVAQAAELGLHVDRRWSAERAQRLIDEKLAE